MSLTKSKATLALSIFGLGVLIIGLLQLPNYFYGINPPDNSNVLSVPANINFGLVQVLLAAVTSVLIWILIKKHPKHGLILGSFIIILLFESMMAIGYSGV